MASSSHRAMIADPWPRTKYRTGPLEVDPPRILRGVPCLCPKMPKTGRRNRDFAGSGDDAGATDGPEVATATTEDPDLVENDEAMSGSGDS